MNVFNERLQNILDRILELDKLEISPQWKGLIHEHNLDYWLTALRKVTTEECKILLAGESAPTKDQIINDLPRISPGQYQPGVYFGLISSQIEPETFCYGGSATKPGFGLAGRTGDHGRKSYRESIAKSYKKDGRSPPLYYQLIDQPDKLRH